MPPEKLAAINPPFIARKVRVQRSHFAIFGSSRAGLMQLAEQPGGAPGEDCDCEENGGANAD